MIQLVTQPGPKEIVSTMTRTDVHAPKNLVTEDYEFVACGYFGSADEPGYSPLAHEARYLLDEGWRMGENESAGGCYHCGANLKYYAILKHEPSHTLVRVGETCLANRFELASAEFHRLRAAAQLDRQAQRVKNTRIVWFAVDQDREIAYAWASEQIEAGSYGSGGFRHTFVSQINRYGTVSDKFVRSIMRDMARTERRAEERTAQEAIEAKASSPVIEGRITVTGEVLSTKWQEGDFGGALKMLVRDDRGFKLWGTVPAAISPDRGDRITFTATVTKSQDDETFGFFKRPSKAFVEEVAA
jgi:hypothetical protein